ncbi:hypothetical protein SAMN05216304_109216 [Bosea sp. OK403]|nr:hypothetical protein SAMN05216304_109216 [Bosea sp. OK403]
MQFLPVRAKPVASIGQKHNIVRKRFQVEIAGGPHLDRTTAFSRKATNHFVFAVNASRSPEFDKIVGQKLAYRFRRASNRLFEQFLFQNSDLIEIVSHRRIHPIFRKPL